MTEVAKVLFVLFMAGSVGCGLFAMIGVAFNTKYVREIRTNSGNDNRIRPGRQGPPTQLDMSTDPTAHNHYN